MILPTDKFGIIYADPPWAYRQKTCNGAAQKHYPVMSDSELLAIPVGSIASNPSVLALWVTCPRLDFGIELLKAWGFTYKTVLFTWVKTTSTGKPVFGLGSYTRSSTELCLLGVRGKVDVKSHSVRQVVISKVDRHSKKPDTVRESLVNLFGDIPRIELFAREHTPGWYCVGNEL